MSNIEKLKADLRKKEEELKKKEQQLEERLDKVHGWLGETLVDELGIDYHLIDAKKDVQDVVSLIKEEMKSNPFSSPSSENIEKNNSENSDLNDKENFQQQNY